MSEQGVVGIGSIDRRASGWWIEGIFSEPCSPEIPHSFLSVHFLPLSLTSLSGLWPPMILCWPENGEKRAPNVYRVLSLQPQKVSLYLISFEVRGRTRDALQEELWPSVDREREIGVIQLVSSWYSDQFWAVQLEIEISFYRFMDLGEIESQASILTKRGISIRSDYILKSSHTHLYTDHVIIRYNVGSKSWSYVYF